MERPLNTCRFDSDAEARSYVQMLLEKNPGLSRDVWTLILSANTGLTINDILRMCKVNKFFKNLCEEGSIWDRIFVRQFGEEEFERAKRLIHRNGPKSQLLRLMTWRIFKTLPKPEIPRHGHGIKQIYWRLRNAEGIPLTFTQETLNEETYSRIARGHFLLGLFHFVVFVDNDNLQPKDESMAMELRMLFVKAWKYTNFPVKVDRNYIIETRDDNLNRYLEITVVPKRVGDVFPARFQLFVIYEALSMGFYSDVKSNDDKDRPEQIERCQVCFSPAKWACAICQDAFYCSNICATKDAGFHSLRCNFTDRGVM
jgi:MYND finger